MLSDSDLEYYIARVGHGDDDTHYQALDTLLEDETNVAPRLSEWLRTGTSSSTRWRCATALARMSHLCVEEALLHALANDADSSVREVAIAGLTHLTDPALTPVFLSSLRDRSEVVRRWSATILGNLKDGRAIEPLILAMNDQDEWTAFRAADALRFAQLPEARVKLEALRDLSGTDAVRRSALQALWEWDGALKDAQIARLAK